AAPPVDIRNDTQKATDAGFGRSTVAPHFLKVLFIDRKRNKTQTSESLNFRFLAFHLISIFGLVKE
ncbi:MAG TPA: hypothetical protein VGI23_08845, partial [Steroidobacteraceae bacterium]